jgi:hypothetical protein
MSVFVRLMGRNQWVGSEGKLGWLGSITVQDSAVDLKHGTRVDKFLTHSLKVTTPSKGILHFGNPLVIITYCTILYLYSIFFLLCRLKINHMKES